ncbi:MAG: hypothetical protein QOD93_1133 [Acetobacteraceae bacterium]|jgi:hypothetical protein|nr:hypothetical protein [Acetobacteraceae bacterium]MEA2768171.1 hypothetical protein [Acetobacteraceae bacterium]
MVGWPPISSVLADPMPLKHNADRRHRIPRMSFMVQNWPEYEAGLRRRGSWFCCILVLSVQLLVWRPLTAPIVPD